MTKKENALLNAIRDPRSLPKSSTFYNPIDYRAGFRRCLAISKY